MVKTTLNLACIFALGILTTAQEKEIWKRLYTGDDSTIEINISRITFGSASIGRARFRTVFSKVQPIPETPETKFKTRLETIEFKCPQTEADVIKRYSPPDTEYRLYEATLLDEKGKVVKSYEWSPLEWKQIKFGSVMEKLSGPACKLINEKERNP